MATVTDFDKYEGDTILYPTNNYANEIVKWYCYCVVKFENLRNEKHNFPVGLHIHTYVVQFFASILLRSSRVYLFCSFFFYSVFDLDYKSFHN